MREFHAKACPSFLHPFVIPERPTLTTTRPVPFQLSCETRGVSKKEKFIQQMEEMRIEEQKASKFKAQPARVLHQEPFRVKLDHNKTVTLAAAACCLLPAAAADSLPLLHAIALAAAPAAGAFAAATCCFALAAAPAARTLQPAPAAAAGGPAPSCHTCEQTPTGESPRRQRPGPAAPPRTAAAARLPLLQLLLPLLPLLLPHPAAGLCLAGRLPGRPPDGKATRTETAPAPGRAPPTAAGQQNSTPQSINRARSGHRKTPSMHTRSS